ncbi:alpha/beta fold hydrolase [Fodinicola acaciae]|uniref:alpha/beta fold hydrolase n=1 Tax=Fodinicola acaciae TaxID=2681555 RepID=UPI0013D69B84|nr:alpha/beta hydrolase [Fodinicola acaciae]
MANHVELPGVRAWYDDFGTGDPLVMLHGGMTDSGCFAHCTKRLAEHFHLYTPDRRAHGRTPDVDGPLTADVLVQDTVDFIERLTGPTDLLGYSAGGLIALMTALARPDLVRRLVLVSGFYNSEAMPAGMGPDENAEPPEMIARLYAEVSPDGADHFPVVWRKVQRAMRSGPEATIDDLKTIASRTLLVAADDDIVRLDHTREMYANIPRAELAIVPGTSHVLLEEKPDLCTTLILDFLLHDPVQTYMPIQRAR